jgi:hypothetical protein
MIVVMVLILNALLYVVALSLSLAVLTPIPERSPRRIRFARAALAFGGGATMTAAIVLSFAGMWFESAVAGSVSIVVVGVCMWFALTARFSTDGDDGEDGDDGGGGPRKRPVPPAPPEPAGGPAEDLWAEFDRARSGWDRPRDRDRDHDPVLA